MKPSTFNFDKVNLFYKEKVKINPEDNLSHILDCLDSQDELNLEKP